MKTKEIASQYSIDRDDFESFLMKSKLDYKEGFSSISVDDSLVNEMSICILPIRRSGRKTQTLQNRRKLTNRERFPRFLFLPASISTGIGL